MSSAVLFRKQSVEKLTCGGKAVFLCGFLVVCRLGFVCLSVTAELSVQSRPTLESVSRSQQLLPKEALFARD